MGLRYAGSSSVSSSLYSSSSSSSSSAYSSSSSGSSRFSLSCVEREWRCSSGHEAVDAPSQQARGTRSSAPSRYPDPRVQIRPHQQTSRLSASGLSGRVQADTGTSRAARTGRHTSAPRSSTSSQWRVCSPARIERGSVIADGKGLTMGMSSSEIGSLDESSR